MRRMLHRCNTAIRRTPDGNIVYAPGIALELELQLDEWYNYLPRLVRFDIAPRINGLENADSPPPSSCPLSNFLRVQYHCCKISIYWPAVYQAIHDREIGEQLKDHCRRFFDSYVQLVPCILAAFRECVVNRWTLFASTFMTTMAALRGSSISCIGELVDATRLNQCFAATKTVDRRMINISPSLLLLADTLEDRLAAALNTFPQSSASLHEM